MKKGIENMNILYKRHLKPVKRASSLKASGDTSKNHIENVKILNNINKMKYQIISNKIQDLGASYTSSKKNIEKFTIKGKRESCFNQLPTSSKASGDTSKNNIENITIISQIIRFSKMSNSSVSLTLARSTLLSHNFGLFKTQSIHI